MRCRLTRTVRKRSSATQSARVNWRMWKTAQGIARSVVGDASASVQKYSNFVMSVDLKNPII